MINEKEIYFEFVIIIVMMVVVMASIVIPIMDTIANDGRDLHLDVCCSLSHVVSLS